MGTLYFGPPCRSNWVFLKLYLACCRSNWVFLKLYLACCRSNWVFLKLYLACCRSNWVFLKLYLACCRSNWVFLKLYLACCRSNWVFLKLYLGRCRSNWVFSEIIPSPFRYDCNFCSGKPLKTLNLHFIALRLSKLSHCGPFVGLQPTRTRAELDGPIYGTDILRVSPVNGP